MFTLFPSKITVTIHFPALDRLLDAIEASQSKQQEEVDALTEKLKDNNQSLSSHLPTS